MKQDILSHEELFGTWHLKNYTSTMKDGTVVPMDFITSGMMFINPDGYFCVSLQGVEKSEDQDDPPLEVPSPIESADSIILFKPRKPAKEEEPKRLTMFYAGPWEYVENNVFIVYPVIYSHPEYFDHPLVRVFIRCGENVKFFQENPAKDEKMEVVWERRHKSSIIRLPTLLAKK